LANCRLTNGHLANRRGVKKILLKVFPKLKVLNATQQNDFHLSTQKILSFFDKINLKNFFFLPPMHPTVTPNCYKTLVRASLPFAEISWPVLLW
jgi:hypothetical protein